MEFKDYYGELGVAPDASEKDIKAAYRRLARKYHPDVSKEAGAEERFKAINEAYEVLRDAEKRRAYDQLKAQGYRPGQQFRPPPDFGQGFEFDFGDARGGGFSDFFESLFGRMHGGGAGFGGGFEAPAAGRRARLEIPLEKAFAGGRERISSDGRTLEVNIPSGIRPGQIIRLAGQGAPGPRGQRGDLLLEIELQPHPRFQLDGRDVVYRLRLAPWEAAMGGEVTVPTLAGPVSVRIQAGSDSGRRLRLRGRGWPGKPAGDQIVVLEVHAPAPENMAQREAYEALKAAFSGYRRG